jgi:hypothetical protein
VHDLLEQIERRSSDDAPDATTSSAAAAALAAAPAAQQPAPTSAAAAQPMPAAPRVPQPMPEPAANPSHVHLVMSDGANRVVMTVAVRGSEIRVAMRTPDEATAVELARNAGLLDDAMRGRGLQLAEVTTHHEESDERPRKERERPHNPDEPFRLEEPT